MSFGKSSGSSAPITTPEQRAAIAAQTQLLTGTIIPAYQNATTGATDIWNRYAPGVNSAAQNQAGVARQVQDVVGSTGESALRTGISGLENLFNPDYERIQIQNALAPAQAQYAQNLEMQGRGFGASGNLRSARQALADRQLAGATQGAQMKAAGDIMQQIAGQRLSAASQLAQLGQGGLGQALGAAGAGVSAAKTPQDLYSQYASILYGTPQNTYTPDFRGTQGTTKTGYEAGLNFKGIMP
jgi:hypothetical protein